MGGPHHRRRPASHRRPSTNGGGAPPHPTLPSRGEGEGIRATVVFLVLAVILNAAVCGILSGPFDRYQARLLWLVPAAALLYAAARRRTRAPI